ncbi:MAG: ABC transporter substrate-binding protein [Gammaproteobacteria bacterium]
MTKILHHFLWCVAPVIFSVFSQGSAAAEELPKAASLNLCADSILLEVAATEQIVSVSWLATDSGLSNYAVRAARYPNNQGRIEELIPLRPDYIFTGENTSAVDNALLAKLGYTVVKLNADRNVEDYKKNLRLVGQLLNRKREAESLISQLNVRLRELSLFHSPQTRPDAIIFQANGYIPGINSLPAQLLLHAGLSYPAEAAAAWPEGRFLSLEELLAQRPSIIIMASLNQDNPSLGELYLKHPALTRSREDNLPGWQPIIVHLRERHLNCGSQFIIDSLKAMASARATFLAQQR